MMETMNMTCNQRLRPSVAIFAVSVLMLSATSQAQTAASLQTRSLAATCASCHGTEGYAVQGDTMVRLAGLPKEYMVSQMLAFREGKRPATVMHQLSKGYTLEQIEALGVYFASKNTTPKQ